MSLNSIQKEDPRTIIQSSKSLTELHLAARPAIEQLGKGYVEFEGVWENTTSGGSDVRVTESGKLRRQVSSRKWKTNITDLTDFDCDLFLEKARPISYNPIQGNPYS